MQSTILLIEDDSDLSDLIVLSLETQGHKVLRAQSAEEALRILVDKPVDAIVTDMNLQQGMTGVELCSAVRERHEDVPVVVMTAYGTLEAAVAAIRAGAYDFVTKPFELDHFSLVLDRALGLHALRREVGHLRSAAEERAPIAPDIVGESPVLDHMRSLISRVAETDSTVVVTGESGTGKELVARALHEASARRNGKFVAINCAAVPEALLESELFGHARGAFTDARAARTGLLVQANGGTLLLDEIGEMPLGMQVKLLRALQERRLRPVGSDVEVEFDARIIAATHRDLQVEVAERRFREDLFYRINVVRIDVPPLRARGNDVLLLAQRFLVRFAAQSGRDARGLSAAVARRLLGHAWPGNVRELQNCMERAVAVSRGNEIALGDLPDSIVDQYQPSHPELFGVELSDVPESIPTMEEVERRYIRHVLTAVHGNKTLAAQCLGFDRRTLYRKLGRVYGADADGGVAQASRM